MAMRDSTFIIAEAGVNHNGSLSLACRLVEEAARAGADAVKFQTFRADSLVAHHAPKADYQRQTTPFEESQYEMLKRLELTYQDHVELMKFCRCVGIQFLSSPFDIASVELLAALGMNVFKIPSGEITNLPYLRRVGGLGREIILSTGMTEVDEIGAALGVLENAGTPKEKITLLHCTSEYPTPMADVNLRAMQSIGKVFGVRVGYSDHTEGVEVPIAAVALGATVIEKHFTLERTLPGPDHRASLEPKELRIMVTAIRNIESALGSQNKAPTVSELKNRSIARKSIVAARPIRQGEVLSEANLTAKRPGIGLSPMLWDSVVGLKAARNYFTDELICLEKRDKNGS